MASHQKSTIVRFRTGALRRLLPLRRVRRCPVRPGGSPATSGSRLRRGWPTLPVPGGGEPFEVDAQGHVVRGQVWGDGPTRLRPDGLPDARLGRPRRAVRGDGRAAPGVRPPGGHVRRTGTRRLRPRAGRPAADQRAWSSPRHWTRCSAGSGRPRRWSRTRWAPSRRTWRCGSAGSAPRRWSSSRRWSRRSRCSTSSSTALGFGPRTRRAFDRAVWTSSSGSRWPSSTHASRPRTSIRCPRWSSPTAATGRRRTPTSSTSRRRSARRWSRPRASGTARSSGTRRVVERVVEFVSAETRLGRTA